MEDIKKVPTLRFPEFSGEWEEKKLSHVGDIITGSTPETKFPEYYNGNNLFVSPVDIKENRFVKETNTTLTDLGISKGRLVKKRSVLFVCIGSTIGKVGQAGMDCITNQQINSLSANSNFSNDFLYSLLFFKSSKIKRLAGKQAVPILNKTTFSKVELIFPSFIEQQKIANFLTKVDKKIEQLINKKQLLERYKKGVMQKIFSKNFRFKDDDGNDYHNWEEKRLKVIINKFKLGGNYANSEVVTKYPLIKMGNLGRGKIKLDKIEYIKNSEKIILEDKIQYGDLFFNTRNTLDLVGKVSIWRDELEEAYYNSNLMLIDFDNNFFMNYRFNSYEGVKELRAIATGTTSVAAIYNKDLLKIKLNIPSLEEQIKIANFLTEIDNKINLVEKKLNDTKQYKKSLLQQMFV